MVLRNHPDLPRLLAGRQVVGIIFDPSIPPLSLEIVTTPFSPRLFLGPRIGLPISQTSHVAAPFSYEMAAGSKPDRSRVLLAKQIVGGIFNSTVNEIFLHEFIGPHRPRIILAPRIPLPLSQTTHVQAPASIEMYVIQRPVSPRIFLGPRIRAPFFDPTQDAPFSIEMVAGCHPEVAKIFRSKQPLTGALLVSMLERVPDEMGLEYTVMLNLMHYAVLEGRATWTIEDNKIHFRLLDEDR
jgi:hypothetical protein